MGRRSHLARGGALLLSLLVTLPAVGSDYFTESELRTCFRKVDQFRTLADRRTRIDREVETLRSTLERMSETIRQLDRRRQESRQAVYAAEVRVERTRSRPDVAEDVLPAVRLRPERSERARERYEALNDERNRRIRHFRRMKDELNRLLDEREHIIASQVDLKQFVEHRCPPSAAGKTVRRETLEAVCAGADLAPCDRYRARGLL